MANRWEGASSAMKDDEERRVLFAALDSFRQYRRAAHYNITHRRRQNFYALPEKDWKMLAGEPFNLLSHFDKIDDAIDANADIATAILNSGLKAFSVPNEPADAGSEWRGTATPADMEKAKSTLRQFYRDWSQEGAAERQACYGPVLEDLKWCFSDRSWEATKVLIPGAGLGRLLFEVCKLGFAAEGNEISFHQLIGSNWVLNQLGREEKRDLYPFALSFSNQLSQSNQLRCFSIPDVHPGTELAACSENKEIPAFERMSMTAADFILLYSKKERRAMFDAVVTVFFIDTAPNFLRYLETIRHTLKPGGYWINLGPLLWHYEDRTASPSSGHDTAVGDGAARETHGIGEAGGVELTHEVMIQIVGRMGFQFRHQMMTPNLGYIQDPRSMLSNRYFCSHFVVERLPEVPQHAGDNTMEHPPVPSDLPPAPPAVTRMMQWQ